MSEQKEKAKTYSVYRFTRDISRIKYKQGGNIVYNPKDSKGDKNARIGKENIFLEGDYKKDSLNAEQQKWINSKEGKANKYFSELQKVEGEENGI